MAINPLGSTGKPVFTPFPFPGPFQSPVQQGNPKQHIFEDLLAGGASTAPAEGSFGPDGQIYSVDGVDSPAPDVAYTGAVAGSYGDGSEPPTDDSAAAPDGGKVTADVGGSFGDGYRSKIPGSVAGSYGDGFRGKFDRFAGFDRAQPMGTHSGCDAPAMKAQLANALSNGGAVGGASGGGAVDALGGVSAIPGQSQLATQLMSLMTMLTQLIAQLAAQSQQSIAAGMAAQTPKQPYPKQMMGMDMSAFSSNTEML